MRTKISSVEKTVQTIATARCHHNKKMVGVVGASGFEPETSAMSTQRSYQLSYAPEDHLRGRDHTKLVVVALLRTR